MKRATTSPRAVCQAVRQILKRNDFPMGKCTGRYPNNILTPGITAQRVGVSDRVVVEFSYATGKRWRLTEEERAIEHDARHTLRREGYTVSGSGYIECDYPD
jgi:hypothetical protein